MRMEFLGATRSVAPSEHSWIRQRLEPNENWKVWIAQLADDQADSWARFYGAQLDHLAADKVGPEHCNVQVSTMVIGNLCAHTVYSSVIDLRDYGYEGVDLTCIWPVRS